RSPLPPRQKDTTHVITPCDWQRRPDRHRHSRRRRHPQSEDEQAPEGEDLARDPIRPPRRHRRRHRGRGRLVHTHRHLRPRRHRSRHVPRCHHQGAEEHRRLHRPRLHPGTVIAIVLALMRLSSVGVYRWIAFVYIEFFRGLPALVVFLVMGFGLPVAFPGFILPQLVVIMIALALVSSAYMAETIRAGIQAVPKGQVEAARSLGMSSSRAMFTIVLPQAMR